MPPQFFSSVKKGRKARLAFLVSLTIVFFIYFGIFSAAEPGAEDFDWYNTTWRYRVGLEIEMNRETRDWPIEHEINFTALLEEKNATGTFDNNSIRVMEYGEDGSILREVPSQFSEGSGFDSENNAHGEVIFLLNDTNEEDARRYFFIYYDVEENGPKAAPGYEENIGYELDGEKIDITTETFEYHIDTNRGDHTSGIYKISDLYYGNDVISAEEEDRTAEYVEYSNGTHNFTFDLSGDVDIEKGPLRLTVTQKGYPVFYEGGGEETLLLEKRYHFYWGPEPNSSEHDQSLGFYRIEQEITNTGENDFTLSASPLGAIRWDLDRTLRDPDSTVDHFGDSNYTDPYSWTLGETAETSYQGVINLPESNDNFGAASVLSNGNVSKLGTNLSETVLEPDETLKHSTFQGSGMGPSSPGYFISVKNTFKNSPTISEYKPESYYAELDTWTNQTIYNRGETVELTANITSDPYNLTESLVAVLDKNTTEADENVTIELEENETGYWTGIHTLSEDSNAGEWELNTTAYTEDGVAFGSNTSYFDVSDELLANLTLKEYVIPEDETVWGNLTVKNIREDENITGAIIDCSYNGTEVENITEKGEGLYSLNFTAPEIGEYELTCTASKGGNTGEDVEQFETEVAELVLDTDLEPEEKITGEVTYEEGVDFAFDVNVSNPEEGIAYSTNISLNSSENISLDSTSENCGDIEAGDYCLRSFEAGIPDKTDPGNYSINVTTEWRNPIGTTDSTKTTLPVEVLENPRLRIPEEEVNETMAGGFTSKLGDFTVESFGNYNLTNISYECQGGDVCDFDIIYDPVNISNLEPGSNETVEATAVEVPKDTEPGVYEGHINASTKNSYDTVDLIIEIIGETEVKTETIPSQNVTASDVTLHENETVDFQINSTNIEDAFAFNITQYVVSDEEWETSENQSKDDLNVSNSLINDFNVTVPENTTPGNYSLTAYTSWNDPDGTLRTTSSELEVTVEENPVQNVPEDKLEQEISPDEEKEIGSLTVESLGNYNLTNVSFVCQEGDSCEEFNVSFEPENITNLAVSESMDVYVNVSVPAGQRADYYEGILNISSSGGYDTVILNVTVPPTRSWYMEPKECEEAGEGDVGVLDCTPEVVNTGNIGMNFTVDPEEANYTSIDPSNFSVDMEDSEEINIEYDVTGDPGSVHRATYNVSTEEPSDPGWQLFNVTLYPSNPPTLEAWTEPDETILQGESVVIISNTTSQTEFDIDGANATVTTPDGENIIGEMDLMERTENYSLWNTTYPDDFGGDADTVSRGFYNVSVTAHDEILNMNTTETNFTVTAVIHDEVMTLREEDTRCSFKTEEHVQDIVSYLEDESVHPELEQMFEEEDGCHLYDSVFVNTEKEDERWGIRVLDSKGDEDYTYLVTYDNESQIEIDEDVTVYYFPGDEGSIYYSLADETGDGIEGAEVNFTVRDPQGQELMSGFGITDEEGLISPYNLNFELPDDARPGIYSIAANATWSEPDVERDVEIDTLGRFAVSGNFDIDWNLGGVWFNGTNRTVWTLIERNNEPRDMDDINLTLYKPNGSVFDRSEIDQFERQQRGIYTTEKWIPNETEFGTYWGELEVREGEHSGAKYDPFRITEEGDLIFVNFDVNMSLHEHEAPQGEYLYFDLSITRMEGQNVDAEVSYWIEDNDEEEYYYASEMVMTPVNQTIDLTRNAYIYQDQPTGNYTAHVKVNPLDGTESFSASESFRVVEGEPETETEVITEEEVEQVTLPIEEPEEEEVAEITIIDAPEFMNLVRGRKSYKSLIVANFGDMVLRNTSLNVLGLPSGWIKTEPRNVEIPVRETETFTVEIDVPEDAELDEHEATFMVSSDKDDASKTIDVKILGSLEEKLREDIEGVSKMLEEVRREANEAEERGINVSSVRQLLREAEIKIENAEQNLNKDNFDASLQDVTEAEGLIREAKRMLETLEEPEERVFQLLPIALLGLGLLAVILVSAYMVQVRHYRPMSGVREKMADTMTQLKKKKIKEKEELEQQKEKAKRLIRLIEAEHEEGIMDDETYENLKSSANEKIERINKKLKD